MRERSVDAAEPPVTAFLRRTVPLVPQRRHGGDAEQGEPPGPQPPRAHGPRPAADAADGSGGPQRAEDTRRERGPGRTRPS
ncbi:hypothetical protein B7767_00605, partial [Streptomyces sp. 13-12-16]